MFKLITKDHGSVVKIPIDNRIRVPLSIIDRTIRIQIQRAFTYSNPKAITDRTAPKYICSYDENDEDINVPRGGLARVFKILRGNGIACWPDYKMLILPEFELLESTLSLYRYQAEAVDHSDTNFQFLVRAPTGSGKTEIGLGLIQAIRQPTLIVVPREAIMDEWLKRIAKYFKLPFQIGTLGGGYKPVITPITVGVQRSVFLKYKQLVDKFGMILCDEAYSWGADTYSQSADVFPAKYRIGLSAWEKRKDKREFLIYDIFGENVFEIDEDRVERNKKVVPVRITLIPTNFKTKINSYPILLNRLAESEPRTILICKMAIYLINLGRQPIIFSERINQCRTIQLILHLNGIRSDILIGKNNSGVKSTSLIKERIEQGKTKAIIANKVGFEGINVPSLDTAISASPIFNGRWEIDNDESTVKQQTGRIKRYFPGKRYGRYYYIWDRKVFPFHKNKFEKLYGVEAVNLIDPDVLKKAMSLTIDWMEHETR